MRWEQVSIGDLFLKKSSNRKQKDLVSEGYPVFGASGLSGFAHDFDVQVPYFGVVKDGAGVGRVSVHPAESSVVGTMECLIPKPGFHFEFLGYCLRQVRFERYVTGSTIPHVYFKDYKNERVALPPLEEQKRIAGILDEADRVRKKTEALIDKYDELAQSLFLDMFGDPVTNPKGWEVKTGSEISRSISVGVVVKPASHYVDDGVLALRSLNVKNNRFHLNDVVFFDREAHSNQLKKSILEENDIVVVRTGNTGSAAIVSKELSGANCIDLLIVRLRQEVVQSHFFHSLLTSARMQQLIRGGSVGGVHKHFNVGAMKTTTFIVPPIKLQKEFVLRLTKMNLQRENLIRNSKYNNALFNALLQKAFKGELN